MKITPVVLIGIFVAILVCLPGCGSGGESSSGSISSEPDTGRLYLDQRTVENEVATEAAGAGVAISAVSCPAKIHAKADSKFECDAELSGTDLVKVEVKVIDSAGAVQVLSFRNR